jgi:hypothetical protein
MKRVRWRDTLDRAVMPAPPTERGHLPDTAPTVTIVGRARPIPDSVRARRDSGTGHNLEE